MKEDDLPTKAYEYGIKYESQYGGCAQTTIAALYKIFPSLENESIFKCASGLGGGIGLTNQGNCCALTAAVMVVGQILGRELKNINDPEKTRFKMYHVAQKLVDKFFNTYNTILCCDIQTKLMGKCYDMYTEWEAFLKAGGHSDACPTVVGNAAKFATEIILSLTEK
ncbi:MAG: C-GCAxxG-C-C family protein [Nitrososphaeria archaeon]